MPKEDLWGKLERQCQGALDRWQGEAREASPGGVETLDQAGGAGCIERRGWGGQELEDGEVPGVGWALDQMLSKVALTPMLWKGSAGSQALEGLRFQEALMSPKGWRRLRGAQRAGGARKPRGSGDDRGPEDGEGRKWNWKGKSRPS